MPKAGHRNGLYRYHSGPFRYHSGPFRSGSIRDGMGYIEPVHGTERYHDLVPVYRYRFIPVPFRSGPVPPSMPSKIVDTLSSWEEPGS
ncbi:hypothetical protein MTR67_033893 [Solanum verrucosum]|uniref:Uncharacterized protein n=1 Tax=Solanum verrucosum TaxID=315347 RepID=A0AAF0U6U5_SOLVR|nr:hypothetical protein MTR67_033893 [Solanum verrucosum]